MLDISFDILPIRDHAFFKKAQFQSLFGNNLFEIACFTSQILDFIAIGSSCSIACQTLLSSLKELLRPAVIHALGNAFLTAKFCNAVLAAQSGKNDPDLFFS